MMQRAVIKVTSIYNGYSDSYKKWIHTSTAFHLTMEVFAKRSFVMQGKILQYVKANKYLTRNVFDICTYGKFPN